MKNLCEKTIRIEYSDVDTNLNLSTFSATNMVQNIMTELFDNIGITNMILKKHYNAAWVISKLKIHFNKHPFLNDKVHATAFVADNSKIRLCLESNFCDENKNTLFLAKQEICPMDLSTRKVRRLQSIDYPFDLELHDNIFNSPFLKLNLNSDDFESYNSYTVAHLDIDFTRHVNNASYVRFLLNTFNSDFFDDNVITDLDIQYVNECREGDLLRIYKKRVDNNFVFLITCNENKIIQANITVQPKN